VGRYIHTDAGLLHEVDHGGQGPLIVLIHGLGGSVENWDAVADRISEAGRVAAIDLPGFGLSPPGPDWELETHAGAITSYLRARGEPATLIGNSLGGLLSEMVSADEPDLVRCLVLVSPATPPVLPDPRLDWPTARRLAVQATPLLGPAIMRHFHSHYTPEQLVLGTLQSVTHDHHRIDPELVESFFRLARVRAKLPWAVDAVPGTAQSIVRYWARRSRFTEMIRRITAPTLVIQGVSDPIVSPTAVDRICTLRPDWDHVRMFDTGHTPQIDAPGRFLDVLMPWLIGSMGRQITA
jgi:pimeloyl-ACP methyl ester carboxylesterase